MAINGLKVIAIEEHFWDRDLIAASSEPGRAGNRSAEKLFDLGAGRIAEMDAAGIDVQVISHGSPSTQRLPAAAAVAMARKVNDRLHAACLANPTRLAGFALLPTADPIAAADELERTVTELGFKGAMINGLSNDRFVDTPDFWPIYARAEKLDVPIYFHPASPHQAIVDTYYGDYLQTHPGITNAAWGFTVEAATQAVRLVISGVCEAHPGVKFIFGHMGEMLPFQVWRISEAFSRQTKNALSFSDIFHRNFYITTSGFFSDRVLDFTIAEMGLDRVLFAIDYPFVPNEPGMNWLRDLKLPKADKVALASGNAERLLRL